MISFIVSRFLPLTFKRFAPDQIVDLGRLVEIPCGFHPTNPSILSWGNGFFVCVRGLNYTLSKDMKVEFTVGETWTTVNRFLLLDADMKLMRTFPDLDRLSDQIEDIKLFLFQDVIYGIGSRTMPDNTHHMVLLRINPDFESVEINDLESPFGLKHEKNWCPFVHDNKIKFVYAFDPLIIVEYVSGSKVVPCYPADSIGLNQRIVISGSSGGLWVDGSLLFVTHRRRIAFPYIKRRIYVSRIYRLRTRNNRFSAEAGSYFVTTKQLQFINGIAASVDRMYLAYGWMDCEAYVASFDRKVFLKTLLPQAAPRGEIQYAGGMADHHTRDA